MPNGSTQGCAAPELTLVITGGGAGRWSGSNRAIAARLGRTGVLAIRTPWSRLRALSLSGLCISVALNVPGDVTPGSYPALQVFLSQRQKFVSFFFFFFFVLACQGQRALSCFMSLLRRRPSQQSVAARSSVLLCAS